MCVHTVQDQSDEVIKINRVQYNTLCVILVHILDGTYHQCTLWHIHQ